MVSFKVFAGGKEGLHEMTTTREIGEDEVLVKVTHSGLCGTDLHAMLYPIGLGHEGVGVVEQLGSRVKSLRKGQRVGWGYVHESCGDCKQCLKSQEQYCPAAQLFMTHNTDQGSLATHGVWNEKFLFALPDGMASEDAGPFMCGGATVYTALFGYDVRPGDRVGVIGIGGLGHLAIQFAAKMGCEVVVFSSTESKRDEAARLGASEFHATKGADRLDLGGRNLDHLIITTSMMPDWSLFIPVMEPGGSVFPMTVSQDDLRMPSLPVLQRGLRVQGSAVIGRQGMRDMLRFADVHGIKPVVQTYPMTLEGIKEAVATLEAGKMRYRGVLVAP